VSTNLDNLKKEKLNAVVRATLSKSLADKGYALPVDITPWIVDRNFGNVTEGLIDTNGTTAGQLISKVDLKLDNRLGDFEQNGRFFQNGFVNNSKIKIESAYVDCFVDESGNVQLSNLEGSTHWSEEFVGSIGSIPTGWRDDTTDPGFNATIVLDATKNLSRVSRTLSGVYGKVLGPSQTLDVDLFPFIKISIDSLFNGCTWKVGVQNLASPYDYHDLNTSSNSIGDFIFDYSAITGWAGSKTFSVQITIEGSSSSYLKTTMVSILNPAYTPYTFNGIIKADASSWNVSERTFTAGLLQAANIIASEIVNDGALGSQRSLAQLAFDVLNQSTIKKVLNISLSNINLGFDIPKCVTNSHELRAKKVMDIINAIGTLSGSKWYVDSNSNFIFEPIAQGGNSSWDLTIDDIVSIDELSFDPLQFNSVTWDDGDAALRPVQQVAMEYSLRQQYGYDCFDKKIDFKWITDSGMRNSFLNNFLARCQHQHRMITFTCKSNPELRFNQIITLNYPQQYAPLANPFIWGKSSWGDGSIWGLSIPGFKVSPLTKWRVLSIDRSLNLSPEMKIVAVQAGIGPDLPL
jgi:hypothetical protein